VNVGYLMPHRLRIALPYDTGVFSMENPATYTEKVMAGNGLYDPEIALGGHQPMLFDQLMTFYGIYYVSACSCTMTYIPASSGAYVDAGTMYMIGGPTSADVYTSVPSPTYIREVPNIRWKSFNGLSATGIASMRHRYSARNEMAFPGRTENTAAGSDTTNPSDLFYVHCIWEPGDAAAQLLGKGRIHMVYYCEFSERISAPLPS